MTNPNHSLNTVARLKSRAPAIPFLNLLTFVATMLPISSYAADYFIDPINGDDANSGSEATPWRTPANVVSYYSGQEPDGHRSLQPADRIFFMNGVHSFTYDYPGASGLNGITFRDVNGTEGNPISLLAYPGHQPIIDTNTTAEGINIYQSEHWFVSGLQIRNCLDRGILVAESEHVHITRCRITDTDGPAANNVAGIEFSASDQVEVSYSIFGDNYERGATTVTGNNRQIVLFGGGSATIHHCYFYQSQSPTAVPTGCGVGYKHASTVPGATFEMHDNVFYQCAKYAIQSNTARSHIHHNLIIDSGPIEIRDVGGTTELTDEVIEFNTLHQSHPSFPGPAGFIFRPTNEHAGVVDGDGPVTFRYNIVNDVRGTGSSRDAVVIGTYESDELYTDVVDGGNLFFNNNCYFNSDQVPRWDLFAAGGGYGDLGAYYSFSEWQGLGYDSGSHLGSPNFDSFYRPQGACSSAGRFAGASAYTIWQHEHFSFEELTNPDVSGPDADADGDGVDNDTERLEGTDPRISDSGGNLISPRLFFASGIEWPTAVGEMYQVQWSLDLSTWHDLGEAVLGDGELATVYDDIGSINRRFYRVEEVSP